MNILYVFPGQGSQYEGMGKDICEAYDTARRIYDAASEVLGYDIADMSFNNPNDELNLTRNTQPALLTHHIACLEVFREKTGGRILGPRGRQRAHLRDGARACAKAWRTDGRTR